MRAGSLVRADVAAILAAQTEGGAILACPAYPTYRYSWLRDGAFCAAALDAAGSVGPAARYHAWAAARVLAHAAPMGRAVESAVLGDEPDPADHLPCRFAESGQAPTSDGWGALQMDGPGLWLWALERHARADGSRGALDGDLLRAAAVAAEYISATWRRPSYDAWEEHGDQLSSSTLAACLAGLLAAHRLGLEAWDMQAAVEGIRRELGERAHRLGYLPRSDTDDAVDASILWCGPLLRAFHPTEPAWTATLQRIEAELVGSGGGVYRYRSDTFYGGRQWPVLTAALGQAYLDRGGTGDRERARACLGWIDEQRGLEQSLPEQATAHALAPGRIGEWVARWGPVASPLTWSHAMTVLLRLALSEE